MKSLVKITRFTRNGYYDVIRRLDKHKSAAISQPQLPLHLLSKRANESVVTSCEDAVPDCLTCGLCCAFPLTVPVSLPDSGSLKEYWDIGPDGVCGNITIERVLPRNLRTGRCMHLSGSFKRDVACSIYDRRPQVCREFDAGSDRCHAYRRMYGLEPQLSDLAVGEALEKLAARPRRSLISDMYIDVESVVYGVEVTSDTAAITERVRMRIDVVIDGDDESPLTIHYYDPAEEVWFESDLLGMSLEDARLFIESRKFD